MVLYVIRGEYMSKYKIGFVILHYMNINVTRQCIDSIQNNVGEEKYKIVIIDNNSPNKSGEELKEIYRDFKKVSVILNKKNDGFARGNNIGYSILRKDCEFICILNNDVELLQNNFYQRLNEIYSRRKFAILGPKIQMLDGKICDLMPMLGSYQEEKKKYYKKKIRYILAVLGLNTIREYFAGNNIINDSENVQNEHTNIMLHGCCLIFSKDYIKNNKYAFDPRTDFYGEEALLFLHARKEKYEILYTPKLTILHKEAIATKTSKSSYKKVLFQLGNTVKSQKILLNELKDGI